MPGTANDFTLIGHTSVSDRGMNAALAVYDHFVYVGDRTDGSSRCGVGDSRIPIAGPDSCPHMLPGIAVVDVADPAHPTVAGQFATALTTGANLGQTSRELRVWPDKGAC